MERKERRRHTREFKLEAVRLAAVGDKTKAKVARELGIRVNQLRQWRLDFEQEERDGVPKQELATAEQDLGTLRRENARLREENDILKKAAASSTGQCNAGLESIGRRAEAQGLPRALIQASGDFVQIGLGVSREIRAFRKVLA